LPGKDPGKTRKARSASVLCSRRRRLWWPGAAVVFWLLSLLLLLCAGRSGLPGKDPGKTRKARYQKVEPPKESISSLTVCVKLILNNRLKVESLQNSVVVEERLFYSLWFSWSYAITVPGSV
jgi:hypothetical protein